MTNIRKQRQIGLKDAAVTLIVFISGSHRLFRIAFGQLNYRSSGYLHRLILLEKPEKHGDWFW